jgi:hypothetical protein
MEGSSAWAFGYVTDCLYDSTRSVYLLLLAVVVESKGWHGMAATYTGATYVSHSLFSSQ